MKGKSDLIIISALFLLVPVVAIAYAGCTDSDGGKNYLGMGTISVPEDSRTFSDYCYDATGRGVRASFCNHPKCYLIEHWCTGSQGGYSVASDRIDCNAEGYNGCRNGECVPISTGCFDGTPEGLCSNDQPYYCSDGDLTENCNRCGCPSGRQCDPSGSCITVSVESCSDGKLNQDETGVDCGGVCRGCEIGDKCQRDSDCDSLVCYHYRCMGSEPVEAPVKGVRREPTVPVTRPTAPARPVEPPTTNEPAELSTTEQPDQPTEERCAGAGLRADKYGDGRCCQGLDMIDGICTPPREEEPDTCSGCLDNSGTCMPIGVRTATEFCDINKELKDQLTGEDPCNNGFECESNLCLNNKCTSAGLIEKFMSWLRKWFSDEEKEDKQGFFQRLFSQEDDAIEEPVQALEDELEEAPDTEIEDSNGNIDVDLEPAVCGNGIIEGNCTRSFTNWQECINGGYFAAWTGEVCDDGNTRNGDGCGSDCKFECTDSDGENTEVAGAVQGAFYIPPAPAFARESKATLNTSRRDSCSPYQNDRVIEWRCDDKGFISNRVIPCANGCSDGACLPAPVPLVSSTVCGNGIVETGEECDDGNDNNTDGCSGCKLACYDSDNGDVPGIRGSTIGALVGSIRMASSPDSCDGNTVIEYFCRYPELKYIGSARSPCATGCSNGACLPDPNCIDSDKGRNYWVKGQVVTPDKTEPDVCDGDSLWEAHCADGGLRRNKVLCENGCHDGACVKSTD